MEMFKRPSIARGKLGNVEFQFNPSEFTDTFGVIYNEISGAGGSYPVLVFGGGKTRTLQFTIFLDGVEKPGSVRQMINELNSYVPQARTGGDYQFHSPPTILFAFGWFVKECILESVTVRYTAFTPDLMLPLRAEAQILLKILQ